MELILDSQTFSSSSNHSPESEKTNSGRTFGGQEFIVWRKLIMKTVFLYAGQGSQKVGMGSDFYKTFAEYREVADSVALPFDAKGLMQNGPLEQLSQTEYTQPCMGIFAAGVTNVLKAHGIVPDAACGLSLGEYGALYAAGVFDEKTYIDLLAFRGAHMAKAAKGCDCSMSAILGLDEKTVEEGCEICQKNGFVTVANYNCPGQYVICGEEQAVTAAETYLKSKGAKRCIRLNVSGPFHTKYMAAAGEALKDYFAQLEFQTPQIPILMNVTGDFYQEGQDIKELLVKQVQSSVHLEESFNRLLESGAETFIEIGPGNVLTGFLKRTAKSMGKKVKAINIETVEDLQKIVTIQKGH